MRMLRSAVIAAVSLMALGSVGGADAAPIPLTPTLITGFSIPTFAGGLSDSLDGFVNNGPGNPQTLIGGFGATPADETVCLDPALGGCSFSHGVFSNGLVNLVPNNSNSNLLTLIYEPDGVTISDIIAIGCDVRDGVTGMCTSGPEFAFVSRKTGGPGLDISLLPTGMGVGWYGNKIAGGAATVFGFGFDVLAVPPFGSQLKFVTANDAAVPEPLTMSVFGVGLAGIAAIRRRRKANKIA